MVIFAYGNSFSGAFVFDDLICITANKSIRSLIPLSAVLFPQSEQSAVGVGGRPVVNLSLAINYALGGTNPWGYHAFNLIVHLAAAWTLFDLVRRTLLLPVLSPRFGSRSTSLALAIALLWAVHPVNTAAVTYVIQRAEALMGLFYLLTLYGVLRGATASSGRSWYVAAVVACILGMATKEVMATAPFVALLYDRTFLTGSFRAALRQRRGVYLALAATWGVIVWGLVSTDFHNGSTGAAVKEFSSWSYLLTQPGVILHYLRLAFLPTGLCLDYGWPPAAGIDEILLPGVIVAGLLGLTIWAIWKRPTIGFLGAAFFVILAPTSSIVPIRDATFDHRLYLSLAAVIAAAVLGGIALGERLGEGKLLSKPTAARCGFWSVAIIAGVFSLLTILRNRDYVSVVSIWEDTIAKAPRNARAYMNLGDVLRDSGQFDEALANYRKVLEIKPDYTEFHYNFANFLAEHGRVVEAVGQFEQALATNADFAEAHNNLGEALVRLGRVDEALKHYQRAVELSPENFQALNNLANTLAKRGRYEEAVIQYQRALAVVPKDAVVHYNFADALARLGRFREAILHLREAARLQPSHVVILNRLAWTLATCPEASLRNGQEAVVTAQKALRIASHPDATLLETSAAAYAEAGQFDQAILSQKQAVALTPEAERKDRLSRLELYQAGKSYHESRDPK